MTDPKIAALATDLGLGLASDLKPLTPIEPVDDLVEFTPTSADYRSAQKRAGWVALYIAGPEHAVPTVVQGLELWPACFGTTTSPRDVKRIAQFWNWHTILLHAVIWCESRTAAESLKTMLVDALDFRAHHLAFRYYNLKPGEIEKLALDVARTARIPVFDEAERMRRLAAAVTAQLKRLAAARAPAKREKRTLPWSKSDPVYDGAEKQSRGTQKPPSANPRIGRMVEQSRKRMEG